MKYIRTEGNLYEVKNENITFLNRPSYECICDGGVVGAIVAKCIVIAQADTIEELCDEFVFVLDHSNIGKREENIMISQDRLDYFKLLTDTKNSKLYGAIWTLKGLIYVAKMNGEGEFELI